MAIDVNETDLAILSNLSEGRCTPSYLEKQTEFTRQAIQGRLTVLRAADYVVKIDTGLYEITDEGRAVLSNQDG
jgi:predicted transcriptional regulator